MIVRAIAPKASPGPLHPPCGIRAWHALALPRAWLSGQVDSCAGERPVCAPDRQHHAIGGSHRSMNNASFR